MLFNFLSFNVQGIDGSRVEKVLEMVHIAANKNTVPGDVSAMVPGGIRMGMRRPPLTAILLLGSECYHVPGSSSRPTCVRAGTPALTSRGFDEEDFAKVAEFFDAAVNLALKIKGETKGALIRPPPPPPPPPQVWPLARILECLMILLAGSCFWQGPSSRTSWPRLRPPARSNPTSRSSATTSRSTPSSSRRSGSRRSRWSTRSDLADRFPRSCGGPGFLFCAELSLIMYGRAGGGGQRGGWTRPAVPRGAVRCHLVCCSSARPSDMYGRVGRLASVFMVKPLACARLPDGDGPSPAPLTGLLSSVPEGGRAEELAFLVEDSDRARRAGACPGNGLEEDIARVIRSGGDVGPRRWWADGRRGRASSPRLPHMSWMNSGARIARRGLAGEKISLPRAWV